MSTPKTTHGGTRPGAGRRSVGPRVTVQLRLRPETREKLNGGRARGVEQKRGRGRDFIGGAELNGEPAIKDEGCQQGFSGNSTRWSRTATDPTNHFDSQRKSARGSSQPKLAKRALTEMKLIMLPLIALVLASKADAKLFQTKDESIQQYGLVSSVESDTGMCVFDVKDYLITEWFNEDGRCEQISYFKKSGDISKAESDALAKANFPSVAIDQDWIEQGRLEQDLLKQQGADNKTWSRVWFTPDGIWMLENSYRKVGKYYYSVILFGTTRACVRMYQLDK
jgi:hypothetical protein